MKKHKIKYPISHDIISHPESRTLKIIWKENIPANEVENCIDHTKSVIKAFPTRTLLIDSSKLKETALFLDWKIIESSWKDFYNNGGRKIIIINKYRQSYNIEQEYTRIIKKYGIPLKLEFKEETEKSLLN